MTYGRVALIGLGLIASSISHAMHRAGMGASIAGYARTPETRAEAARLGLAEVYPTAAEAVRGADLVILCVPVGAMEAVAREIGPHLARGATVTDVGSVKGAVIAAVAPHLPPTRALHSRAIRWRGPSIPAQLRASPNCSTIAGAC